MAENKQAHTAQAKSAGAKRKFVVAYKDSIFLLPLQQYSVFNLLKNGYGATVRQVSQRAVISHPNAVIRDLRHKGINVRDVWERHPESGSRYKRFFIDPKECKKEVQDE